MARRGIPRLVRSIALLAIGVCPAVRLFAQDAAEVRRVDVRAALRADVAARPSLTMAFRVDFDGAPRNILFVLEQITDENGNMSTQVANSDEFVDSAVFGQQANAANARTAMEALVRKRVDEIVKTCRLPDDLRKKLELAGQGDIRRLMERVDALRPSLRERLLGDIIGAEGRNRAMDLARRVLKEAEPLRALAAEGSIGEGSLFRRVLERFLTAEQFAVLRRGDAVRSELRVRVVTSHAFRNEDLPFLVDALGDVEPVVVVRAATGLVSLGRPALESLLEATVSPSPQQRMFVAKALGSMRHPRVPPVLSRLLYDDQESVRENAGNALVQLALAHPSDAVWRPAFESDDPERPGLSSAQIDGALRKMVLETFGAALRGDDRGARLTAARNCHSLHDPELIAPLAGCVAIDDRGLRKLVFAALAVIYHPDALEPLLIGLKDELPDVRDEVMGGLRYQLQFGAARKDERVFAALLVALDDSNDAVRAKAAGALGTMRTKGYDRMLPHLIGATRSASRIVVQAAIDGLTALGDPRAADRLFELADTPAFGKSAAIALANLGDKRAAPFLRPLVEKRDFNAISALAVLRDRESAPLLIDLLAGAKDPSNAAVANALGAIGDSRAVGPLIGLLTGDRQTIDAAATSLGRLSDPRAVDGLLEASRRGATSAEAGQSQPLSENPAQNQLAWALIGIRFAAVDPLGRALSSPSEHVRGVAAWVLYNLTLQGGLDVEDMQPAIEPLLRALDDPAEKVRSHAALALGAIGDARSVGALLKLLAASDNRDFHYGNAAGNLSRLGDPGSVEPLLVLLRNASPLVRTNALRSLVRMQDQRVVQAVTPLLQDAEPTVREAAIRCLGVLRAPVSLESQRELLRDEQPFVREAAAEAAGRLGGPQAPGELAKLTDDASVRVRVTAAMGLLRLGDARGVEIIARALADESQKQREEAASALVTSSESSDALVPSLARALYDSSHSVRVSAISVLGRIGNRAAADALIEKTADREHLTSVLGALGRIRDPQALESLVRHLADRDPTVRAAAASAVGRFDEADARAPLIARLTDPASEVRLASVLALTRLKSQAAIAPLTAAAHDDPHAGVRTAAERAVRRIGR